MALQLAVDISNWQGNVAQETFARWRSEGAQRVICGTDGNATHPVVFPAQIERARAAGLDTEAYIYLYFGSGGTAYDVVRRTNLKLDMIEQVGSIQRVWLDCEDTTSGLTPAETVGLIASARDAVLHRGVECGIYTGRWWWVPYTNNDRGFWDRPLWLAAYDGVQSLSMEPLGGWTEMQRKQYTDKGALGGVHPLDLNVEPVPTPAPLPPPAPSMPISESPIDVEGARADLRAALAKLGG